MVDGPIGSESEELLHLDEPRGRLGVVVERHQAYSLP